MAQQRNNIARLPPPLRDKVSELVYAGDLTQEEIEAAIRREAVALGYEGYAQVQLHGTSFLAWRESKDYQEYVSWARGWDDKVRTKRWAAGKLNDGRGPQSVADLAAMGILEQLQGLADGELLETGKDVARVATAIATMQRTQLAQARAERDSRIAAIEQEHLAEMQERDAEIARLKAALIGAGVDPDAEPEAKAGGLSPAALKQIEKQAKLL
jgi:hypothetical protein